MAEETHTIVAGVSALSAGDPTLQAAIQIAGASGAGLHLVHAWQLPRFMTMAPGLEMAFPEGTRQYEQSLLASLETAARALPGGEAAKCRVVMGSPAPVIADVAGETGAELVVVGAARGSRVGRAVLGTTAQRVLRASPVPVLVARRPAALPPRRVLLTTDLSELSAAVHESALDTIDRFFGAPGKVRSLLVVAWALVPPPLTRRSIDRIAREELDTFLRDRGVPGQAVEPAVRSGFAADEIVAEARAWDADLLVVGTHARGWGARMMLGSVAESALREAPCNVLAVPPVRVPAAVGHAETPGWNEPPGPAQWPDVSGE
jgi:nucleotide-binding universal stress UspA family protein